MNVLIINGSPRKNGITALALEKIRSIILNGNAIININVYEQNVKPCVGCFQCRPDKTCILPRDDGHYFAEEIRKADLIILASPTYWGNMSGKTRQLFERCVPVFEYIEGIKIAKKLIGKKAIVITCCGAPYPFYHLPNQASTAIKAMKSILQAGGIKIVGEMIIGNTGDINKAKLQINKKVKNITKRIRLTTAST